jgi:two-component system CheB/CheR fusion protein
MRLPIDFFFRSLAQDQGERAICVVLSGTGSDGTLGLKAIKEVGGMAMTQAPESAAYDGMPRSAIATNLVDYVLPPDEMPRQLLAYVQRAFGKPPKARASAPGPESALQKVFGLLRAQTGHDFSGYKRTSILRRIERRMAVTQINPLEDYVRFLQANPLEVETLFRELLIGVTNFFRDPQAYEVLAEKVVPELCARSSAAGVRIWVPACSTGEEAYSLAMLLQEYLETAKQRCAVQIFATDIDAEAIERARAGVYSHGIAADVGPERLARFFAEEDGGYRIRKSIRDTVVFAKQDVLKDPPFSRLDLISCRNMLIYMDGEAQKKVVRLFHYALNPDGYLVLGNSETIGSAVDLWADVDKKWRIFRRRDLGVAVGVAPPWGPPSSALAPGGVRPAADVSAKVSVRDLAERVLLDSITPPSVLINADCEVLYVHGHTGRYLEPASGEASVNLLRMAREGLRPALTLAVRRAIADPTIVRYDGVRFQADSAGTPGNGGEAVVNLIVQPVTRHGAARGLLMVTFEEVSSAGRASVDASADPDSDAEVRVRALEQELRAKEEYLQSTIEELQTGNEELRSTNEELQSANEELQSTNEEMNTTKEELQSVNEELATVNAELHGKIDDVGRANNDLSNLLASTDIGTLFVDHQLRVQRFTPATSRVVSLIQTDVGRPVSDIVARFRDYHRLAQDVQEVLDSLIPKERVVQHHDGSWYQLRIQPYRTVENVIEGAVLTFVDVTQQKSLQLALQASQEKLAALFEILPVGVSVLDAEGQTVYANPALEKILGISRAGLLRGDHVRRQYLGRDGVPMSVEEAAGARALREQRPVHHVETGIVHDDGAVVWVDMSAVPMSLPGWRVVVVTFNLSASRDDTATTDKSMGRAP